MISCTGDGLEVHALRLQPGAEDILLIDGTISAVLATSPEHPTPRGLRAGDQPRRAWELYGCEFADMFYYDYPEPNGPITTIGFFCLKEPTLNMNTHYVTGPPAEWFESPAFWES